MARPPRRPSKPRRPTTLKAGRIQRDTYGSKDEWKAMCARVKERDRFTCQGKGCGCTDKSQLQVHHILPLTRGGRTTMLNLITLCVRCHEKRHDHLR